VTRRRLQHPLYFRLCREEILLLHPSQHGRTGLRSSAFGVKDEGEAKLVALCSDSTLPPFACQLCLSFLHPVHIQHVQSFSSD
jgi:hypothetical protein